MEKQAGRLVGRTEGHLSGQHALDMAWSTKASLNVAKFEGFPEATVMELERQAPLAAGIRGIAALSSFWN